MRFALFRWAFRLLALVALGANAFGQQPLTTVRLLTEQSQVTPGSTVYAAVQLKMPPGWHTYWLNPSDSGDSGQATRIEWTLPDHIQAGAIQWPTPTKLQEEVEAVLTYSGTTTLLVPLTVSSNAPLGPVTLKAKVRWLECEKSCVQGKAELSAPLAIAASSIPSPDAPDFSGFRKALPTPITTPIVLAWMDPPSAKSRRLSVSFTSTNGPWDLYPEPISGISFGPSSPQSPKEGRVVIEKAMEMPGAHWPGTLQGLIALVDPSGHPLASQQFSQPIQEIPTPAVVVDQASAPSTPESAPLAQLLVFAFIGGLILNIMPCVLPVIALKILGFVRQSQESPRRIRLLGLSYGAGVIASFSLLGVLVIAIKLAGKNAHQGLLFQNPIFLVCMTTLMVLIALNLFGLFEVSLSGKALDGASQLASQEGPFGAFMNGVLATVLATPCTAPFLGVSIGFALGQDAHSNPGLILLFFVVAGLGLALPYVTLCLQPRWLRLLPKPGAWMVRFKVIMGFPMMATAVWLFSLSIGHYDSDGLLWLGLFLVTIALGAWIFGEFVQRAEGRRLAGGVAVAGVLAAAYLWMLEGELNWRDPIRSDSATAMVPSRKRGSDRINWEPWSPAAVAQAQAEKKPILVDFTASWCVTCQANKRTAIEVAPVIAMLKTVGAVTLLGDFTHEDPGIAAELRKHRRAGVPLVLVYSKDPARPPKVLPEVLSRATMLEALEWAANPK
jgi:thiol:disulfide interchange protein